MNKINFGTDGWRAIISDDFTFDNVKMVAQSIADYVKYRKKFIQKKTSPYYKRKYKVVVGYDLRFLSEKYAEKIACVLAANGINVILTDRACPTPSVSYEIVDKGYLGGVMVTASHNPGEYNGIKYKEYYGGSAGKDATDHMESKFYKTTVKDMNIEEALKKGLVVYKDIAKDHIKAIQKFLNLKILKKANLNVLVDSMNGTGLRYIEQILKGSKNKVTTINSNRDPYFGKRSPEPNEYHLIPTSEYMKNKGYDVALATDGDGDRLGVLTGKGEILSGHKVMTLLLLHLFENKKKKGVVVQTICGTSLIDKIAAKYKLKTFETPVGFKYISDLFESEDVLIGGEETGGVAYKGWLPERDGILSGLLILEMIAYKKKSLVQILKDIDKEYGTYVYKRFDLKCSLEKKKKLIKMLKEKPFKTILGREVVETKTYDGFKFIFKDKTWVMLRPSGTEPKLRVYSEGRSEKEALDLLDFGKIFLKKV
ncbi:MAG: phosphoglucomutase/phosphomannomutase family protein [Candidatus Omnitrophica bacterium]|nr:phosphoglucomutase/phosphomannomutase family protein [Candidatus Omnitrophota bacterium]